MSEETPQANAPTDAARRPRRLPLTVFGVVEFVATSNLDAAIAAINSGSEQIDPLLSGDSGS